VYTRAADEGGFADFAPREAARLVPHALFSINTIRFYYWWR
jgi:hypothetical protein